MEHEPILQMGTNEIIQDMHIRSHSESGSPIGMNGSAFLTQTIKEAGWYTDRPKTNEGTGARLYNRGLKWGIASFLSSTPHYCRQKYTPLRLA
jgi:hypothetical protein